ncbi:multisubunit sodium/proton antiporter MrpE subunit [Pontibacter ummariensis]|uniref:Multisubunit sodium/proton antiporter, MrpE subunit n=1 Tax=Pontibacter ummariensis TaxID=1610492 RepID=A0A239BWG2_9BACT|nr:Na+/H+ antiporter subunit E [Pontibacter ummariensis]PRY15591.1 multisubunit sodium/proton antiporter MrpE subunit [Pontibacter ummariensis]SNS11999.1 multisubunit sodium/proton antiporter, MrpE subunit [Pontibacter ummariensis]
MKTFLTHCFIAALSTHVLYYLELSPLPYNALGTVALFLLIMAVLWLSAFLYSRSYFRKLPKALNFAGFFLKELLVANLKIAFDILTPHYYMRPTVLALPLAVKTNFEITFLANMISLTPGTLSIDLSEDRKHLYVHALYVKQNDIERLKRNIKHGFERRLLELTK